MIRSCAYLLGVTLIALGRRDDLLAVRFAWSPAWETLGALRTLVDERSRAYRGRGSVQCRGAPRAST